MNRNHKQLWLTLIVAATYGLSGCGPAPTPAPVKDASQGKAAGDEKQAAKSGDKHDDHDHGKGEDTHDHKHEHGKGEEGHEHAKAGHDHSGWWCDEHGIPEEECALCNPKLAAEMKKKGDWCEKHDRPDSQCFICHPEKMEEYAARYEAKYGKKPPKPELN